MNLHDGDPFWPRRDGLLSVHPPLSADLRCDVVVVGGGITGALVGLELTRRGQKVIVLDRRDVAGGSTSASTAMLQYEIDELLVDLVDALGWDRAATAYSECARGIDLVERASQAVGDNCGFRRSPSVFMAVKARDLATLGREFDARAAAGFDVRWLDATTLMSRWGLVGRGAIESAAGASVDPYRLCHRALETITRLGGQVYDRTEVVDFELSARRVRVATDRGVTVTAKHAVVATGYEVARLLPDLPVRLHSSFALVTEPIPDIDRRYPDGLLFWDLDDPYLYGRVTDDRRILIGGKDETYRDALRRRRALPSKTRALAAAIPRRLPTLDPVDIAFSWAGTFAETLDGLAYIGTHATTPRCHYALGFGGNGITYSALAAEYIADGIVGGSYPDSSRLFDLNRPEVTPSSEPITGRPR